MYNCGTLEAFQSLFDELIQVHAQFLEMIRNILSFSDHGVDQRGAAEGGRDRAAAALHGRPLLAGARQGGALQVGDRPALPRRVQLRRNRLGVPAESGPSSNNSP